MSSDQPDYGCADAPAFIHRVAESSECPLVIAVPHSGRCYPAHLMQQSTLGERDIRESEDAFVDQLVDFAPEIGADLLVATHARAYVDLNRSRHELDPDMFAPTLEPAAVNATHRVRAGLGVIPRIVAEKMPIYTQPLPAAEAEKRLSAVWDPYHGALRAILDRKVAQFGRAVLIDCHSMPDLPGGRGWFDNFPRVVIGDNWGRSCSAMTASRLESLFRRAGLSTRRNVPYAGGYATCTYGKAGSHVDALQLELARGLYMRPSDLGKTRNFAALRNRLRLILEAFVEQVATMPGEQRAAE